MVEVQTQIHNEVEHLKAEAWHMSLRQNASDVVHHRRHMSRLPPNFEPTRLFNTPQDTPAPGAGMSTPEAPVIPQLTQVAPQTELGNHCRLSLISRLNSIILSWPRIHHQFSFLCTIF